MNVQISNSEFFEKKFRRGFFYGFKHKKSVRKILRQHGPIFEVGSRPKILVIGFGKADELLVVSDHYPKALVVGLEIYSKRRMKSLSQSLKEINLISIISGDINALDFDEEYFDLVLAFNALDFSEDASLSLSVLLKSLKRGGAFICTISDHHQKPAVSWRLQYQKYGLKTPDALDAAVIESKLNSVFKTVEKASHLLPSETGWVCKKK